MLLTHLFKKITLFSLVFFPTQTLANTTTQWEAESELIRSLNGFYLEVTNPYEIDLYVELKITLSLNTKIPENFPDYIVLSPGETSRVALLERLSDAKPQEVRLNASATPGSPYAVHDERAVYYFPIDTDAAVKVGIDQVFGGTLSHNTPEAYYSVDIRVPVGTPVLVAREGIIVSMVLSNTEGGLHQSLRAKGNSIRILHDDGTMALYAHLKPQTPIFDVGDRVAVGEKIAYSGNTGYSSGPHLHFSVQVNRLGDIVSVPFRMAYKNQWIDLSPRKNFSPIRLK